MMSAAVGRRMVRVRATGLGVRATGLEVRAIGLEVRGEIHSCQVKSSRVESSQARTGGNLASTSQVKSSQVKARTGGNLVSTSQVKSSRVESSQGAYGRELGEHEEYGVLKVGRGEPAVAVYVEVGEGALQRVYALVEGGGHVMRDLGDELVLVRHPAIYGYIWEGSGEVGWSARRWRRRWGQGW
jgi:hypothetical protein